MNPFKQLFILIYFLLFFVPINVFAVESSESNDKDKLDIGGMIMHHILDDYQYEIMHGVVIPLPIILYTDNEGLIIFSSSNLFDENHEPIKEGYRGFYYDHGHIAPVDKSLSYIDFSITKNVFFLFLNASLMLFVFLSVASKYRNKKTTPKGIQSLFEPIIIFIRDDIVKPNIGEKYETAIMIINDNYDLVSGWKKKRYDSIIFKNIPSKIFNFAARLTSGIKLNDFNCGLKAYKSEVIKNIEVYGEMHRYIPVLAKNEGFNKIGQKVVKHRPRKYGKTKFGPSRFIHGFLDLITIWFISKFGKRPMHLFGRIGLLMLLIGFLFAAYLGYDKLFINPEGEKERLFFR